jgi:hypothetical protein
MQLTKPIGASLAAATCGLLGALPAAPAAAQDAKDWDIESSLLYYGEDNDRVKDVSLDVAIRRALDEDRSFSINLTVDSLTGATPNGAVPTNDVQVFTGASGGKGYIVEPGEVPLDPTFLDTRIAASANWQQGLGESSRWNVGMSISDEYDYFHVGANARFEHDFNLKNTTAYLGIAYGQDDIKPVGGAPIGLTPMVALQDNGGGDDEEPGDDDGYRDGGTSQSKDVADLLVGVTQILSRRSLLELSYSYGKADGYLTEPYKILSVVDPVTGIPVPGPDGAPFLYLYEKRPDQRTKQSVSCGMAPRLRPRLDGGQLPVHDGRLGRDVRDRPRCATAGTSTSAATSKPHLRYYTQTAADVLPHRYCSRTSGCRVRLGRLPARGPRRVHRRREVRSPDRSRRVLRAARVLPAGQQSLAGLGGRRARQP